MKTYKIACIPGDGIGKEVVPAGQTVLAALAAASMTFKFDFENFGWGGDWYPRWPPQTAPLMATQTAPGRTAKLSTLWPG